MATSANSADERLEARISAEQKRLFKEAATLRGVTLTDFVVSSVHEAAVRTLEARHVIELSQTDQRAFVDALARPPAPKPALRRAWARHRASPPASRKRRSAKRCALSRPALAAAMLTMASVHAQAAKTPVIESVQADLAIGILTIDGTNLPSAPQVFRFVAA